MAERAATNESRRQEMHFGMHSPFAQMILGYILALATAAISPALPASRDFDVAKQKAAQALLRSRLELEQPLARLAHVTAELRAGLLVDDLARIG